MSDPVISLKGLNRWFETGAETVNVLKDVDLDIRAGEMVAIIGQSGSGKSTLMNILGCLDRPSAGTYNFSGREVARLGPDQLAELRREHFGFIFQRYQLLADLDAVENVEMPAIYAGVEPSVRRRRAIELLTRLGLGERLDHRPAALSGGQQQRVSVARALMNGGEVILADEPTGALDSHSGKELMALLDELHEDGHTIIIVTHDPLIAAQCDRVIEIADGEIIGDSRDGQTRESHTNANEPIARSARWREGLDRAGEALRMAMRAMIAHKLRTFLTMLGIIIGIASVVSVVALGQGSQQDVLERISSIGTNTINVYPGSGFGDRSSNRIRTLKTSDAEAIAEQGFTDSVSPLVSANTTVLYRNTASNASVTGVSEGYFRVNGRELVEGVLLSEASIRQRTQDAVIDETAQAAIFPNGEDPLGQVILLDRVPMRVIGVVKTVTGFGRGGDSANIYVPYTTAMDRILGRNYLDSISVRVRDDVDMDQAETELQALMSRLHGTDDFFLQNTATIRDTIEGTSATLTLLISTIAIISLVVGGIGVMNIMLVSVSERTKEIGIRMAVGARRGDILRQFLIEAVLVCFIGGGAGVALSFGLGAALTQMVAGARLAYSTESIVLAIVSSSLIGVVFGFMPARSAARLDPVEALARE
ncbi:MacB family efflux pump subunit [Devosia rhodophyticola]|uniref:Pyoverdine export ATP-binding/permease protein PvdT n=1 Tax=Devosia rhodophyticola TaxID=3026423 RepID=A0ABY7YUE0_9HYPH|nr:MacB family efflux pump subunit [Devosia rhodophyticola]WDR04983.1 MacB family efflux pump subunit [Devosia rhodophyticola]